MGFVNAVRDADGVLRRVPLFIQYGTTLHPSLALAASMHSGQSEAVVIESDTLYGAEALAKAESASGITDDTSFLKTAQEIALTHHEKWDGTGYPYGLKGKNIPLSGRLMALADVYDALISERVYKKAMSHGTAADMIRNRSGTHFDPEIVHVFETLENEFLAINLKHTDRKEHVISK